MRQEYPIVDWLPEVYSIVTDQEPQIQRMEMGVGRALKLTIYADENVAAIPRRDGHVDFVSLANASTLVTPTDKSLGTRWRPALEVGRTKGTQRSTNRRTVWQPTVGRHLLTGRIVSALKPKKASNLKMIKREDCRLGIEHTVNINFAWYRLRPG